MAVLKSPWLDLRTERLPRARSYPVAAAMALHSRDAVPAAGFSTVSAGIPVGAVALHWQGPSVSPPARAASRPWGKLTIVVWIWVGLPAGA